MTRDTLTAIYLAVVGVLTMEVAPAFAYVGPGASPPEARPKPHAESGEAGR
jgi:hypothetical protein